MLTIFANSFLTATRNDKWDAPPHWRETDRHPTSEKKSRMEHYKELRRWLRDTGVM